MWSAGLLAAMSQITYPSVSAYVSIYSDRDKQGNEIPLCYTVYIYRCYYTIIYSTVIYCNIIPKCIFKLHYVFRWFFQCFFFHLGAVQGVVTGIRGLCTGLGPALFGFIFYLFNVDLNNQDDSIRPPFRKKPSLPPLIGRNETSVLSSLSFSLGQVKLPFGNIIIIIIIRIKIVVPIPFMDLA